jgi:Fur family zinc uptake transcriptional regulator
MARYIGAMARHDHTHHEHSGKSLIDAAREALTGAGEQWTGLRADVFEELARHEKPASAYDISDNLSAKRGKRVAPNSVYRILDLFVANNLALRVESANAFLANSHPGCLHDCIFLVCDNCGEATHVDDDAIANAVRGVAQAQGFRPERPIIEIRGLCAACS